MSKPIEVLSAIEMANRVQAALDKVEGATLPIRRETLERIVHLLRNNERRGVTGHLGVTFRKDRGIYEAYYREDGKRITLYRGTDGQAAIAAREAWEKSHQLKEHEHEQAA